MLTFHEPSPVRTGWIVADQLGAYPTIGTQVRARVTEAGIEVGAFPALDAAKVLALAEMLAEWRPREAHTATCMVVGVHGAGPVSTWGPAFASRGGGEEVDEQALVAAVLQYLHDVARP